MIICIDNIGTILEGPWEKDNELLSFAIGNIVEEIVQQQYYGNTFCISMEEYGIIFSLQ
ncbi:MAG: hypothetical protein HPY74_17205 [Firmicutes bacterium]|nr:hypothetical protein [Bacillota bacterium]